MSGAVPQPDLNALRPLDDVVVGHYQPTRVDYHTTTQGEVLNDLFRAWGIPFEKIVIKDIIAIIDTYDLFSANVDHPRQGFANSQDRRRQAIAQARFFSRAVPGRAKEEYCDETSKCAAHKQVPVIL